MVLVFARKKTYIITRAEYQNVNVSRVTRTLKSYCDMDCLFLPTTVTVPAKSNNYMLVFNRSIALVGRIEFGALFT
ncbi:hypothetical protein QVD17_00627 [Tagetes erecta]|uniref:Uncharacterized protein n=1 Tax=Tagetes erecta TaxID=13708 RepID=A0AAD8L871_TARER|nr:hypothetical protein QVD17_00627 [Tagetes erecta]